LDSVFTFGIQSAMFAPLVWGNQALGAICVDSREHASAFTKDDLRLLQAVAHHAALAIANLQLQAEWKQQAEVQSNILKLVSPQIADRLLRQRGRLRLGGEFCNATMLFADLRGFTNLSATMSLDEVTEMLEDYFQALVPVVYEHEGTIFKFIGDEIFAVFGSPNPDEQQHRHAVLTAFAMQDAMIGVNAKRAARHQRVAQLGIGIHCGEVVNGLIGAAERMEFTVIGDAVNRASRYCDGAGGGETVISTEVYRWVWNLVDATHTSIETKHEGDFAAYKITPKKPRN
jgi:adenylate cyclase